LHAGHDRGAVLCRLGSHDARPVEYRQFTSAVIRPAVDDHNFIRRIQRPEHFKQCRQQKLKVVAIVERGNHNGKTVRLLLELHSLRILQGRFFDRALEDRQGGCIHRSYHFLRIGARRPVPRRNS
jgi:hypothetical protein